MHLNVSLIQIIFVLPIIMGLFCGVWVLAELVRRAIYARQYPDYHRQLSYAEQIFVDDEVERLVSYHREMNFPFGYKLTWLRDSGLMALSTVTIVAVVYTLQRLIMAVSNGSFDPGGIARAPLIASLLGVSVGALLIYRAAERSERVREFVQYKALSSKKLAVGHIEHFLRAGMIDPQRPKSAPDLMIMMYMRFIPLLPWAIKITLALTVVFFALDIIGGG